MLEFFLNPLTLWGLPAVSIPLLIYLLYRQRYRRVEWAAMEFLLRALKKNRRRLRVENLLILILRMLIILLLVLAFARPLLRAANIGNVDTASRHVGLMLDQSFSMSYRPGTDNSAMEKAKSAATRLLQSMKEVDQVVLSTAGERSERLITRPTTLDPNAREEMISKLGAVEWDHGRTDLASGMDGMLGLLDGFPEEANKQLYVFTDMQRNAWLEDEEIRKDLYPLIRQLESKKTALRLVDVGDDAYRNAALVDFSTDRRTLGVGMPFRFIVTVENFCEQELDNLTVTVKIERNDGSEQALTAKSVELEPFQRTTLEFPCSVPLPGIHQARAELQTDPLQLDNARYLTLDVREAVDILLVDGDPDNDDKLLRGETDYLELGLNPALFNTSDEAVTNYLNRMVKVSDLNLDEEELDKYDVIFLCNVAAVDGHVERFESFVRNGGGLWIFLGDQVDPTNYNNYLFREGKGLLPARLGEVRGDAGDDQNAFVMRPTDWQHPAFKQLDDPKYRPSLFRALFSSFYYLDEDEEDPRDTVLARFEAMAASEDFEATAEEGGAPALVVRRFGQGRVVVLPSSAAAGEYAWSRFSITGAGVTVINEMVKHLLGSRTQRRNLELGEAFNEILPSSAFASEVSISLPPRQNVGDEDARTQEQRELTPLISLNHAKQAELRELFKPQDGPDDASLEQVTEILDKRAVEPFLSVSELRQLVTIDAETYRRVAPLLSVEKDQFRLFYEDTRFGGVYQVEFRNADVETRRDFFAVNVEAEEGRLNKIVEDELKTLFPDLDIEVWTPEQMETEVKGTEGNIADYEIWWELLVAALLLKVVESILAWFFGWKKA